MKERSAHAMAASEIRRELKKAYPTIKFSVTSECFSMGNSVRIHWTDGPTADQIDSIVKKYQFGNFDGMKDLYEYDNHIDGLSQVKYVQTSRTISDVIKMDVKDKIEKLYGIDMSDERAVLEKFSCWPDTLIYRETYKTDYTTV
jgi:hypothetical protein